MRKKILTAALLGILISISSSGMTLSYLTDSDESISNFTVGKISIKSIKTEENCQALEGESVCTQTLRVNNIGNTAAYVRVRIMVPIDASFDGLKVDFGGTDLSKYQKVDNRAEINNIRYDVYDFYYNGQLAANVSSEPVIAKFKFTEKLTTETNTSESCTPEEGETSCETEAENTSVNIKDVGIKTYTQAIQSTGFSSVREAFNNY